VHDVGRLLPHGEPARRHRAVDGHDWVRALALRAPAFRSRAFTPLPSPKRSNHEEGDNANFIYAISATYRFAGMPTGGRNDAGTGLRYYSWEAGPVHYISIDSFYDLYGPLQPITKWVEADLAGIDYAKTPWVVVSLQ